MAKLTWKTKTMHELKDRSYLGLVSQTTSERFGWSIVAPWGLLAGGGAASLQEAKDAAEAFLAAAPDLPVAVPELHLCDACAKRLGPKLAKGDMPVNELCAACRRQWNRAAAMLDA